MGCLWKLIGLILLFQVIGWIWRNMVAPLVGGATSDASPSEEDLRQANYDYLDALMPLLAKIAKSDGHINEAEIDGVERIFRSLKLQDTLRRYAQQVFIGAKDDTDTFETYAVRFAQKYSNLELRFLTFQFIVRVACADNRITATERALLMRTAEIFSLPFLLVAQVFAQYGIPLSGRGNASSQDENTYRRQRTAPTGASRVTDLELLGLSPSATDVEIKQAYRQKAKELHPDRLQAQGLPEAMLKQASERMAAVNGAYERLKKNDY